MVVGLRFTEDLIELLMILLPLSDWCCWSKFLLERWRNWNDVGFFARETTSGHPAFWFVKLSVSSYAHPGYSIWICCIQVSVYCRWGPATFFFMLNCWLVISSLAFLWFVPPNKSGTYLCCVKFVEYVLLAFLPGVLFLIMMYLRLCHFQHKQLTPL